MLLDFNQTLFDIEEGYIKGNSFKNLYNKYKNYKEGIPKITNDSEALLTDIMMLDFTINDLYLYTLTHKDDQETKDIMKKYIELYNKDFKLYNEKIESLDYIGGKYV